MHGSPMNASCYSLSHLRMHAVLRVEQHNGVAGLLQPIEHAAVVPETKGREKDEVQGEERTLLCCSKHSEAKQVKTLSSRGNMLQLYL